ncbi:MAG: Nif11 family protein [Kiritimatiellales bacterium]|nr:Nif11 family protein [Kiritimatiellales bacterium]
MSKKEAERFLIAGGDDRGLRARYDQLEPKETFVEEANKEGFAFSMDEFDDVLRESGDSFESFGNPRKRGIWWM